MNPPIQVTTDFIDGLINFAHNQLKKEFKINFEIMLDENQTSYAFERLINYCQLVRYECQHIPKNRITSYLFSMFQLATFNMLTDDGWSRNKLIATFPCVNVHLDMIRVLHENDLIWNEFAFTFAIKNDRIDVFNYLIGNNLSWSIDSVIYSCRNIYMLKCFVDNGFDMSKFQWHWVYGCHNVEETFKYLLTVHPKIKEPCDYASASGNMYLLTTLHRLGYPWTSNTSCNACANNHLEIFKYLHESGCPVDENCYKISLEHGYEELQEYIQEFYNFEYDDESVDSHEESCLDALKQVCVNACKQHNLPGLTFLHDRGCPLSKECMIVAREHNDVKIIEYLKLHGCPDDEQV